MKFDIFLDTYNSDYLSFTYFNLNQNFDFKYFGDTVKKIPIGSIGGFNFLDTKLNCNFYEITFLLYTTQILFIEIDINFPSQLIFTFLKRNDLKYLKDFYFISSGIEYIFSNPITFKFQNQTITITQLIEQKSIILDKLLFFFTEDENNYIFGFRPIKNFFVLQKNQNYNYALSKPFLSHPFGYPQGTLVQINNYNQTFTIQDCILVQNQKNLFDPFYLVQNQNNKFLVKQTEIKEI